MRAEIFTEQMGPGERIASAAMNARKPTALVTGASSGIGDAFARQLASRGHDLVVVARDEERLGKLAADLSGADVEIIAADLTDEAQLAAVEDRLRDAARPIDVLVNNAGFGTTGRFHELPVGEEDREIRLNVLALMRLSHAALGGMVERRKGGIVNIASIASFAPSPGNATYGGTKAFVSSFSQALHEEYRALGVDVLCVCPGATRTEFHGRASYSTTHLPGAAWQTADEVADASLKALAARRAYLVPGLQNKALAVSTHLAPRGLVRKIAARVSNQL